jgi:hypothetical protein
MLITLKANLMSDPERKAAVDTIAQLTTTHAAKLKEVQSQSRLALSAESRLTAVIDSRDAALDASMTASQICHCNPTPTNQKNVSRSNKRLQHLEKKFDEIKERAFEAQTKLQAAAKELVSATQELINVLQEYEFSLQESAPLPRRR